MAAKTTTKKSAKAELAYVPFYDYLWQFYQQNRAKVRRVYTRTTRAFLDFNDPGEKGGEAFLRRPQFEALEMYVFLKEYCDNARVVDIFRDWHKKEGPFDHRGAFKLKVEELSLFEHIDNAKFEAALSRLQASAATYPNYIYALTMGLGKTILMATCIFYEFILSHKYPKEKRYCHNALVFAPDKTVLQSLKEIQTFEKAKVVPPEYVAWLEANLKFQFLDDTSLSLQIIEKSEYNIIISNNQKIILKRSHKEKSVAETLFGAEKKYEPAKRSAGDAIFGDLDGVSDEIESEEDLIANQRFEMLKRLANLGIYVDEAHHAFGKTLEKDFSAKNDTSLRTTINLLARDLAAAGSHVVACYNYTGTPYVNNMLLPEVVYTYSLKNAIDNRFLKKADVRGYENTKSKEFVRIAIRDFWEEYGGRRFEGMMPKMAIFASEIRELNEELRPAVEEVLSELGISLDRILVNVGDDKLTTNDDLREFINLDTARSEKQFILLVNKGKEGWNCRSLFSVALFRQPKSRVFVLQATMRCLRSIGTVQETGRVYLSNENYAILAEELQNNFRLNIDEFTGAGERHKIKVSVREVPPPVTVKLKRIKKQYELKELNLEGPVDFKLDEIDTSKYTIVETRNDLAHVEKDRGSKKVLADAKTNEEYSPITLTAEIARYLGKGCIEIEGVLEKSREGMSNLVAAVNRYNEILFDHIIPRLFRRFYDLEESVSTEEIELRLVAPPKGKGPDGGGDGGGLPVAEFSVAPDLLAKREDDIYKDFVQKSFHLDNYCFDSRPEYDFFKTVLKDEEVEHLYFTGMLTSGKTEFKVSYVDPESQALRNYYPDFLAQKKDGSYVIVEVKGENKLDDPVVLAKKKYARELAYASRMEYLMVPGMQAGYGLHQPRMEMILGPRVYREDEIEHSLMYVDFLPVYGLQAACSKFGATEVVEETEPDGWIDVSELGLGKLTRNLYVVRASGDSMDQKIADGQYCVMEYRGGTCDENDIVLAELSGFADGASPEGAYVIKQYTSEATEDGSGCVTLKPLSNNPIHTPIVIRREADAVKDLRIVGVLKRKI